MNNRNPARTNLLKMSTKKHSSKTSKSTSKHINKSTTKYTTKSKTAKASHHSTTTSTTTENTINTLVEKHTGIGLEDPQGLNNNPLTNKPYENLYLNDTSIGVKPGVPRTYAGISTLWTAKLVYNNRHKLYDAINKAQVILAVAGTGVGKSILIPRIALHALDYKDKVICCIPKRLPTQTAASFVAGCMDVPLGQQVGYYFQGTNMTNKNGVESKLIFTTTGSLISRLTGNDPTLADYKCVIVDEAHERSVQTDQLLLLLKKLCLKRPDIKVIIMSATISLETFRDYFPASRFRFAEIDMGSELSYPIQDKWLDKTPDDWKAIAITITMNILKMTSTGDIMIFVKSAGDANMLCNLLNKAMTDFRKKLADKPDSHHTTKSKSKSTSKSSVPKQYQINPLCLKLEGSSNKQEQRLATDAGLYKTMKDPTNGYPYTRKIVIATNVAESSITVDGIVFIIDSGYEYTEGYDPNARVRSLLENQIAHSAVIQRRGRAGRTQPGYCFHLYTKRAQEAMQPYPTPSIEKSDITSDILNLMKLPEAATVAKLRNLLDEFISPPHEKFILNSLRTLHALGAITSIQDDGVITPIGIAMSKFRAIEPTHARAVIASHFYGVSRSVCDIIALATETDGRMDAMFQEFRPDKKKKPEVNKKEERRWMSIMRSFAHPLGDYMTLFKAYKMYLKIAGTKPTDDISPEATLEMEGSAAAEQELLELASGEEAHLDNLGEDIKQQPGVRKWCRENYVNANRMVRVRRTSQQIWITLQQIVRPLQHRRDSLKAPNHRSKLEAKIETKQEAKLESKQEAKIEKEIEKIEEDVDTSMTEINDVPPPPKHSTNHSIKSSHSARESLYSRLSKAASKLDNEEQDAYTSEQAGGFIKRIQQQEQIDRLEPHVRRFPTEEENIMMALAIGNFVNLAIRAKQGDSVYVSCFATNKKFAKVSQESFLTSYGTSSKLPSIVMYDEIFQSSHEARFMKLNLVSKIPDSIFARIKELYGAHIKYCI